MGRRKEEGANRGKKRGRRLEIPLPDDAFFGGSICEKLEKRSMSFVYVTDLALIFNLSTVAVDNIVEIFESLR